MAVLPPALRTVLRLSGALRPAAAQVAGEARPSFPGTSAAVAVPGLCLDCGTLVEFTTFPDETLLLEEVHYGRSRNLRFSEGKLTAELRRG